MCSWFLTRITFTAPSPGREAGALNPTSQMRPLSPGGVGQPAEVTRLNSGGAGMDPGPLASVSSGAGGVGRETGGETALPRCGDGTERVTPAWRGRAGPAEGSSDSSGGAGWGRHGPDWERAWEGHLPGPGLAPASRKSG